MVADSSSMDAAMVVMPLADPYDAWIAGYDGLPGLENQDDPDRDGVPNGLEFLLGWNPADGVSRFSATLAQSGDGLFRLSWPCGAGAVFTIRSSADLRNWSRIEAVVTSRTGARFCDWNVPVPTGEPRFYRVEWMLPAP